MKFNQVGHGSQRDNPRTQAVLFQQLLEELPEIESNAAGEMNRMDFRLRILKNIPSDEFIKACGDDIL
jgi:hypothetical protein